MGQALRDLARKLQEDRERAKKREFNIFRKARVDGLDHLTAQVEYAREGYKRDIRFARRSEYGASYFVQCLLCGASGLGASGGYEDVMATGPYGWQRRCCNPHTYECACGLVFVHSQQLGAHVAAHRRHRNQGHGRLDQVGYGAR